MDQRAAGKDNHNDLVEFLPYRKYDHFAKENDVTKVITCSLSGTDFASILVLPVP